MESRLRKRWGGLDASIVTADSVIDAGRCADKLQCFLCACTMVSQWKIKADDCDIVTMISHAILGGNYKRGAHPILGTVIVVFWHWMVGSTDKPQTLYSSYLSASHWAEHNQNELCVLFIHMHVPDLFGELLVSITLVVWR